MKVNSSKILSAGSVKSIFAYLISALFLLAGCSAPVIKVSADIPQYSAKTVTIKLVTDPSEAMVFLDGRYRGVTPLDVKITYLHSPVSTHESETVTRMLRIEKEDYKPYVLAFSLKDMGSEEKEENIILEPVIVKQLPVAGPLGIMIKKIVSGNSSKAVLDVSPDKKWLMTEGIENKNYVLEKISLENGETVRLSPFSGSYRHGMWLPNMGGTVFVTKYKGSAVLMKSKENIKEDESVMITPPSLGSVWYPALSADGNDISFSMLQQDGEFKLCFIRSDGFNFRVYGTGRQPSWSPDGRTLVFVRKENDYDQIFKVDTLTGSILERISQGGSNDFSPDYSPDGNYVAFISDRAGKKHHIFVMSIDGKSVVQLTDGIFDVSSMIWGTDGYIYFSVHDKAGSDIWRLTPGIK